MSTLTHSMACRLYRTKPLSEVMVVCWWLDPCDCIWVRSKSKYKNFQKRKCFENIICKMVMLFRSECVKSKWYMDVHKLVIRKQHDCNMITRNVLLPKVHVLFGMNKSIWSRSSNSIEVPYVQSILFKGFQLFILNRDCLSKLVLVVITNLKVISVNDEHTPTSLPRRKGNIILVLLIRLVAGPFRLHVAIFIAPAGTISRRIMHQSARNLRVVTVY